MLRRFPNSEIAFTDNPVAAVLPEYAPALLPSLLRASLSANFCLWMIEPTGLVLILICANSAHQHHRYRQLSVPILQRFQIAGPKPAVGKKILLRVGPRLNCFKYWLRTGVVAWAKNVKNSSHYDNFFHFDSDW